MRPRPASSPSRLPARLLPRAARVPLLALLALVASVAACGGEEAAPPVRDDALDRDLTLAASRAAAPIVRDSLALGDTAVTLRAPVAEAPAPTPAEAPVRRAPTRVASAPMPRAVERTPAPAPVPEAAVPAPVETPAAAAAVPAPGPSLASGTTLTGATGTRICSTTNRPGDRLVATLSEAAGGPDGLQLPAGTGVVLEVARATAEGQIELIARGVSIEGIFHPLVADVTVGEAPLERRTVSGTSDSRGKAAKGAIAGAIIGQILGRDTKGTVIGAATGAAAGAVAGQLSKRQEVCLPAGAPVRISLVQGFALR